MQRAVVPDTQKSQILVFFKRLSSLGGGGYRRHDAKWMAFNDGRIFVFHTTDVQWQNWGGAYGPTLGMTVFLLGRKKNNENVMRKESIVGWRGKSLWLNLHVNLQRKKVCQARVSSY